VLLIDKRLAWSGFVAVASARIVPRWHTFRAIDSHGGFRYPRFLNQVAMANGTVDFFNDTGGYGFIDTDDADDDVFFHMEDVGGPDLEEGQDVEFDIEESPKGPRATNLERL